MAEAARPPPDISQVDLIMGNIFQHLNTEDTESCLQAFHYWDRYIQIEGLKRQEVYPFFWTWPCKEHGEIDGCNVEQENPRSIHDDIRKKVGKYSSRRCVPLLFCTERVVEDANTLFPGIQTTVIADDYQRFSRPGIRVSVTRLSEEDRERCQLRQIVVKALKIHFPCSPQVIISSETDLLWYSEDLALTDLSSMSHAVTGFIIPQYPGFEVHNFEILTFILPGGFPADANIKGFLVFSDEDTSFCMLMALVNGRKIYEIAIGGYKSEPTRVAHNGSIVAFCGENVQTASLVVNPLDEGAESKMRLFQETTLLKCKCFAFVFNCSKVEGKLNKKLAETFTQLYPNIPLAGLTTETIYGVDYLPGVSEEIKSLYLDYLLTDDRIVPAYKDKSVFVLVSIKP